MTDAEMIEWLEMRAEAWRDDANENEEKGWDSDARECGRIASSYTIAAAALRWYAITETGGDDHAERQAIIAACKESTR